MKQSLFPLFTLLMTGLLLADVPPRGCSKRQPGPPIPPVETPPPPPPATPGD
jgi:hypothetical protein